MNKIRAFVAVVIISSAGILCAPPAYAGDPALLGTYGDWKTYSFTDTKGKVCFMTAKPARLEVDYPKRSETSFFITHWAGSGNKDVVSVAAGYTYKKGSSATVEIDANDFNMFTEAEMAWAENADTDHKISEAVRKGSSMTIKGTSFRGVATKDVYSLKGSGEAYDRISRECGF